MYKLFYSLEVVLMTKMSILNKKLRILEDIEAVLEAEIKPLGNGAMAIASKKYIGKKAYIVIRR